MTTKDDFRFEELFNGLPIPLFRISADNRFLMANRALLDLMGYPDLATLENTDLEKLYVNHEDRMKWKTILNDSGRLENFRIQLRKYDGVPVWIEVNASASKSSDGSVLYYDGSISDISDRIAVEEKYRKSDERLQLIMEATEDGFYDLDIVTGNVYCNPRYNTMVGYDANTPAPTQENWHEHLHPDDRQQVINAVTDVFEGRSDGYELEYRMLSGNGEWKWILDRGKAFALGPDRKPRRLVGTHIDISYRKNAEEALGLSEDRYRRLVENITDVLFTHDAEGIVTYISPSISRFSGYTPDEVIGTPFVQYIHEDDLPVVMESYHHVIAGHYEPTEYRMYDRDRSIRYVRTVSRALHRDGKLVSVTGMLTDITTEKELLLSLKNSEQRYRLILENIEDGYFETDLGGTLTFFNESLTHILGYTRNELIGKNYRSFMSREMAKKVYKTFNRVYKTRTTEKAFNWDVIGMDGSLRHIETSVSVISDHNNTITGFRGIARDITERTIAEEKIRNSLLEKEILLKEIHHRVKNNFQLITSMVNLQMGTINDSTILSPFREIQNRIRAMALIHEKLYQSRDISRIDFAGYLRNITQDIVDTYTNINSPVTLSYDTAPVYLTIDQAIPCGLIINELITNSLKYAFHGEYANNGIIEIKLEEKEDKTVVMSVGDNGPGLAPDIDPETSTSLGLFLTTLLVKQIKGTMTIFREGGTLFVITFLNKLN